MHQFGLAPAIVRLPRFYLQPMNSLQRAGCLLWLALALAMPLGAQGQKASTPSHSAVAENYGKLPLSFEVNKGQSDPEVKFQSQGSGYSLYLTDSSAVLALTRREHANTTPERAVGNSLKAGSVRQTRKTDVIRMELAGASRNLHVTGVDQLPGKANYFIGNDPAKWHSDVPTYSKVQYAGVYPGIDLVYYGNKRQLEYDFVVAPGANPKPIRLQFAGAKKLKLTADGGLTVAAPNGEIAFHKPFIYQVKKGQRQPIQGRFFLLAKNVVSFTLGEYDHTKPLVIDPVLVYSTYFFAGVALAGPIAVDSSGNAYVTGSAGGGLSVTTGAFQKSNEGIANVFVTKINPTGTALVYSTYLGGTVQDTGTGIAVDSSGNAYVTGATSSQNFPVTTGAYQIANDGMRFEVYGTNEFENTANAFVTKLNPTGTALIYSTYLGGSGVRFPNNQAAAPGQTLSPYAYVGDSASSIAVDSSGSVYITGLANSTDFPVTAGAFQPMNNSPEVSTGNDFFPGNAFVTKLNPTGTALVYSTYLGGRGNARGSCGDMGQSIAVDGSDNAYVTGIACSTDFPVTTGAFQTMNNAAANSLPNAFVAKINPTGTALIYSTYLGGSSTNGNGDSGSGIAVDGSGNAYVTGTTSSANFPVTAGSFQTMNNSSVKLIPANAFIAKLNQTGTGLIYSTYLGGSGSASGDVGTSIAVDSESNAYVIGNTDSINFPVTPGAFQTVNNAAAIHSTNAFITKLNPTGTALLYSTYLGGSGFMESDEGDSGTAIAVDNSGNAYVTGGTDSTNFPVTAGALQITPPPAGAGSSFIAKLNLSTGLPTPAVSVTPSLSSITTAQALNVTVSVSGISGNPTPTGTVELASGSYTSAATSLSSGSATINIPAGSLATGSDILTASYTPDSNSSSTYNSSTGKSSAVTVMAAIGKATPTVTVNPSAITITNQESDSVTVTVTGGSSQATPTGTVILSSSSYSAQQTLTSGTASFTIAAGTLSSGANTLTAAYSG
ncbi:MAG: SBBP repeat-containing protein [Edaphobacter sp.]